MPEDSAGAKSKGRGRGTVEPLFPSQKHSHLTQGRIGGQTEDSAEEGAVGVVTSIPSAYLVCTTRGSLLSFWTQGKTRMSK